MDPTGLEPVASCYLEAIHSNVFNFSGAVGLCKAGDLPVDLQAHLLSQLLSRDI